MTTNKHHIDVTYEREDDETINALAKGVAEQVVRWYKLAATWELSDGAALSQCVVDAQNFLKAVTVPEDGIEVRIHYSFYRGQSEQGPSYASGGEPAEPASVEFERAEILEGGTIDAADLDAWSNTKLQGHCLDWAIETACADNEPDPDDQRDAMIERRQMEREERDRPSDEGDMI